MAKQGLNQTTVTLILSKNGLVLIAEGSSFLVLESEFAFKLANVFCEDD